jgi:cell division transport system permease protein
VTLEDEITLNIRALRKKLQEISPNINLDDHQQWLSHLNDLTTMVRSIAFGILFLVVMAAVSIVIFGTKAGMAEHKNTIQVVHMLGASDGMIAKSFQKRFFYYGFRGGVIGFLGALVTIFLLYNIVSNLGENLIADVELPVIEISFLFLLPVLSAFLSMFTARITVLRALKLMV